jgi:hypothetical protein
LLSFEAPFEAAPVAARRAEGAMNEVLTVLGNLGERTGAYFVYEALETDEEPKAKFQALEGLSELETPRTVRAVIEILKIFKD